MNDKRHSICIDNVSKKYKIYESPLDRIKDALGIRSKYKEFLALDNVSLNIGNGEFWGILGKNGSGKSTLLKIIARQLQPTTGTVDCESRITLLQLGIGFDPELSGLENIALSRMTQNLEIDYEDVINFVKEFSELGDFINYPVKTYSSGMYSRLAFATAIAGDPDVLIADEVLAVGDMSFSQKCLAKMREFKDAGKTVVVVTHDINSIKNFCDKAAWINNGKLISVGKAKTVAEDFRNYMIYGDARSLLVSEENNVNNAVVLNIGQYQDTDELWRIPNEMRRTVFNGSVKIDKYRFIDSASGEILTKLITGNEIMLEIALHVNGSIDIHSIGFTIHNSQGLIALHLNSEFFNQGIYTALPNCKYIAKFKFDVPMLSAGEYSISIACFEGNDAVLAEKYDFDSTVLFDFPKSILTERQGGYIIIPKGDFRIEDNV